MELTAKESIEDVEAKPPVSKTEFVKNQLANAALRAPTILDTMWDLLDLEKTMEHKYDTKINEIKINYFKFFVFGMLFSYASIFLSLKGIGVILSYMDYFWLIASFFVSVGFAFVWGKFKEVVPLIWSTDEKLKNIMDKIVSKLS